MSGRAVVTKKAKTAIKPITDAYIERMAGVTGTKGKLLKALKEEKAMERFNALDRAHARHRPA